MHAQRIRSNLGQSPEHWHHSAEHHNRLSDHLERLSIVFALLVNALLFTVKPVPPRFLQSKLSYFSLEFLVLACDLT